MDELSDEELLGEIAHRGRMMRALAVRQSAFIKAAQARGISKERISTATQSNPTISQARRAKNRGR